MSNNIVSVQRNDDNTREPASIRNIHTLTNVALLAAVSFALSFLEFPVPLSPSFARMDISDFPALVGSITLGPWAGLAVELIKNLLGLFSTSTGGVGELANFLIGGTMVFTAGMVYYKCRRKAWLACMLGSVAMSAMAALANYFILLPLFENFMPMEALIASFSEFIPFIHTKLDVVLLNAVPFNLLKGLGISLVTLLVYPKLIPALRGKTC